ncbi:MAG: AAA-like domain-containing protein [Crocosphaera sp.]|nr:AAA-like domain-containing protein [Crocosphaera sp.]
MHPGALVRIPGPKQTGKSSLALKLLAFAKEKKYHTLKFSINEIESNCATNLNQFLRCFCKQITQELKIESKLDEFWDEDIGSKLSCSYYLKHHILRPLTEPLVLVLEDIDSLFESPQLAQDFFPLLRSWYEEGKRDQDWQKLRLVVVYSSEIYINLDLNHSPFNVGLPVHLPYFTLQQVREFSQKYGF